MTLLKAVGQAITTVIQWISMVANSFLEWLLPSEWSIWGLAILVIFLIIKIAKRKRG